MRGVPQQGLTARDEALLLDPQAAAGAVEWVDAMVGALACSPGQEDAPEARLHWLAVRIIEHLAEECVADDVMVHDEIWSLLFRGHDPHTVAAQAVANLTPHTIYIPTQENNR